MFGNMACQIIGYYLIAIAAIPLGYGHVTRRRWARTLSMTLLWFWLVVGVPLSIVFLFILVTAKDLSLATVLIAIVALGASYLVLPGLLIRFYRSRDVRLTFETRDPRSYRIEELPLPILVLCALCSFYTIVLHVPIFFNGMFPLFGDFVYELPGILMLDVSIMLLVCLIWGTWRRSTWAWWGGLVYFNTSPTPLHNSFTGMWHTGARCEEARRHLEGTRRCDHARMERNVSEWEYNSASPRDPGNCVTCCGDRTVGLPVGATLADFLTTRQFDNLRR